MFDALRPHATSPQTPTPRHPSHSTRRPPRHDRGALRRVALLGAALGLLSGAAACRSLDRSSMDVAEHRAAHQCAQGNARPVDPARGLIGCGDGIWRWDGAAWHKLLDGAITAGLPAQGERPVTLALLAQGHVARIPLKGEPTLIDLPRLAPPPSGTTYRWQPAGLGEVAPESYVSLHSIDSNRVVAVTSGHGAVVSDDHGLTWEELSWNPRFAGVDGSRPLVIEQLRMTRTGRVAMLLFPEGRDIAAEQFDDMLARGLSDTREGGGPVLVTGFTTSDSAEVRALPLGPEHHALRGPNPGRELWLFVGHHERHESTRFLSRDWGRTFLDTGYYDFRILHADGDGDRFGLIGVDDAGLHLLYMRGRDKYARLASLTLPDPDDDALPMTLSLAPGDWPESAILTQGPHAVLLDLAEVTGDGRLRWTRAPIIILVVLSILLILGRWRYEHTLRNKAKAQNHYQPGLGTAVAPEDPDAPNPYARPTDTPTPTSPQDASALTDDDDGAPQEAALAESVNTAASTAKDPN